MVTSCDLTANVLSGIQLGSGYTTQDNSLADNVVLDCAVNGDATCGSNAIYNGIVTYGTSAATNIIQNNFVKYCQLGYSATTQSTDIFASNMAKTNFASYSSNITYTSIGSAFNYAGVNLTTPVGNLVQRFSQNNNNSVFGLAWLPDTPILAVSTANGSNDLNVYSYDGSTLTNIQTVNINGAYGMAWNNNGVLALKNGASSNLLSILTWDGSLLSQKQTVTIGGFNQALNSVCWNPDGSVIAVGTNTGSNDLKVYTWNGSSLTLAQTGAIGHVYSVSWNSTVALAVGTNTGSNDLTLWIWEGGSSLVLAQTINIARVQSLAWSPDGSVLAVAFQNTVNLYSLSGSTLTQIQTISLTTPISVAWNILGSFLSVGTTNDLRLYSLNGTALNLQQVITNTGFDYVLLAWCPIFSYYALAVGLNLGPSIPKLYIYRQTA